MGYGLIDVGRNTANTAVQGLSDLNKQEQQRKSTNKQLKAQYKNGIISGAGAGAAIGTLAIPIPGVGTAIGAVVGGLAASLF